MKIPRIVLAGTASGAGKTSITCAIIHGLRRLGYDIQAFKVGPDYIDPGYLSLVSGRPAHNLDVWLMGGRRLLEEFTTKSQSDISVIEGVMGYYDGFSGSDNHSSTHHVASITKSKTILVLDAARAARSIAATALGFVKFHRNSRIAGIILNRVGSRRHELLCRDALSPLKIPIVGVVPKSPEFALESRHLGLIPAVDQNLQYRVQDIAAAISEFLDLECILDMAHESAPLPRYPKPRSKRPTCTIAVALDDSFNFYYPSNLESLQRAGARIKFFSPVSDKKPPACDGIYIGGGFPEVRSSALAKNSGMRHAIKRMAGAGLPLYAECGGLMYLTRSIHDEKRYPMVGLLDAKTVMTGRALLNYTKADVVTRCIISGTRRQIHGHEFHYSKLSDIAKDLQFAYNLKIGCGISAERDGIIQDNTLASYCHLLLGQKGSEALVSNCMHYSRR